MINMLVAESPGIGLALNVIGAVVVGYVVLRLVVAFWRWSRLHWLRRLRLPGPQTINLTQAIPRLERVGWDIKISGIFYRRGGFGFLYGSPPVYSCERCHRKFATEEACIAHEKEEGHERDS